MRKVMFAMNISIDGCYGHTSFGPDEDMMDYFTGLMLDTGVLIYGRKTYELIIPYWPDVAKNRTASPGDIAFADALMPIEKFVLSRTLTSAAENTTVVNGDPEGLIRRLKQQPGKKIALSSTTMLPRLLELGLIDELYLIVHPVLVGDNKHLFDDFHSHEKLNFRLIHTQVFKSGPIALHYQKMI